MSKLRDASITQLHQNLAEACKNWTSAWPDSTFSQYVVKHGIDHLFQIGDLDGVRERLLNLYFFARLYELADYPPILRYWRALGDDPPAEEYQQGALELLESDDFESAKEVVQLFSEFCDQVYWLEVGIDICRRLAEKSELFLGAEHSFSLGCKSDLGNLLTSQGKYEEAEILQRQALEGRQQTLGPDHPDTLISLGNLAGCLNDQGKYEEAEALHRQALEVEQQALGSDHPSTLTSLGNLALFLEEQGKYEEAEALNRQVLEGRQQALGHDHSDTLTSQGNLALVFGFSRQI